MRRLVLLLVALAALSLSGCANVAKAEAGARAWAATAYPDATVKRILCDSYDSDNNGRVSCDVHLVQDGTKSVQGVECKSGYGPQFGRDCRAK